MTTVSESTTRLSWRVAAKRRTTFLLGGSLWQLYFVTPILLGIVLKVAFDGIADARSGAYMAAVIAVYGLVELGRRIIVHRGAMAWIRAGTMIQLFLRGGMLRAQVSSGGPHAGPVVPHGGAAMTRFRDDPRDVAMLTAAWVDLGGAAMFGLMSVIVMASIDAQLTLVVLLPVTAIALTTRLLGQWIAAAHRRHLEQTALLTALLRDVFAASGTIRLYGARDGVAEEVRRRAAARSRAAVADHMLTNLIRATSLSLTGVAIGLMLLLVVDELRSGRFSVGDMALFVSYLGYLSFLPRMVGHTLTRHRQAGVAWSLMAELAAGGEPAGLLEDLDLSVDRDEAVSWSTASTPRQRLETVSARALGHRFDDGHALDGVDFDLGRGTLTVLTGAVGSGKTTLVRALMGLVPGEGVILWNGTEIVDVAGFMVPPHASYLPQTPQLFSDTLAANIRLGHRSAPNGSGPSGSLGMVLDQTRLSTEVSAMAAGTDTTVGPRGVRLSGGQRQRLALARALYRQPELLVLDDLSSAVDAETEVQLWAHLRQTGVTVLAVSNRPIAIDVADQVLTLDHGRLV